MELLSSRVFAIGVIVAVLAMGMQVANATICANAAPPLVEACLSSFNGNGLWPAPLCCDHLRAHEQCLCQFKTDPVLAQTFKLPGVVKTFKRCRAQLPCHGSIPASSGVPRNEATMAI